MAVVVLCSGCGVAVEVVHCGDCYQLNSRSSADHVQWACGKDVPKRSCDDDGTSYPMMPFLCPIVFGG
ncbi:hypothetical protein E2C01_016557 [Portunus trituberculatus]|uniref:Uncharacterized protein n=1 Tax=Portunus trituberculatus TaxID=210409 RepID=A0A5B7DRF3_PORTR|nr:hypothetical protein [Portunus trituberculatus]